MTQEPSPNWIIMTVRRNAMLHMRRTRDRLERMVSRGERGVRQPRLHRLLPQH